MIALARSLEFERTPAQLRIDRLVAALSDIPQEFVLTPTYHKVPIRPGWQTENLSRSKIQFLLEHGGWVQRKDGSSYRQEYDGIALIIPQGHVVADIDGITGHRLFTEITGQKQPSTTVAWSSGKPHNGSLLYRLPDELTARIAALPGSFSKIRLTECPTWKTHGSDAIELLMGGSRATLPPSAHPETKGYEFKMGWDCGVQPAPDWIGQAIEAEVAKREFRAANPLPKKDWREISEEDIRTVLEAIDPSCSYDDWIAVGMALHSTGNDSYLELWDEWSSRGSTYKAGECEQRWASFRAEGGIGLGRLFFLSGIWIEGDRQLSKSEWRARGFSKLDGGKGKGEIDRKAKRDWLIHKRMRTFRTNYKQATDRALYLSTTPEAETIWYRGWRENDPLKPELCAQTILIRGGLGSGKTEAMLRAIALWGTNRQIIWITSRQNLNAQTGQRAEQLGLTVYSHQSDVKLFNDMLRTGQPGIYTFCLEGLSNYHTMNIAWSRAIVVIDEFSGVRGEAPSSDPTIVRQTPYLR